MLSQNGGERRVYCFRTEDDLDLLRIAESGQCFRWNKTEDHCFRVIHAGYCVYMEKTGAGEYRLDCTEEEFQAVWRPYLDLDLDYRKVRKRIKKRKDPFLAAACEKDKDAIATLAIEYLKPQMEAAKSFKVESKRSDKSFPMTSIQLSQYVFVESVNEVDFSRSYHLRGGNYISFCRICYVCRHFYSS